MSIFRPFKLRESTYVKPQSARNLYRWLPHPGSVLFTLLVVGMVLVVPSVKATPTLDTLSQSASASSISYQGYLTDSDGNPVDDNMHIEFVLYERLTLGNELGCETHEQVQVTNGIFQVELGGGASFGKNVSRCTEIDLIDIADLYAEDVWLEIRIRNEQNIIEKLQPRQRLTSVSRALNAERLGGKDASTYITQEQFDEVLEPVEAELEELATRMPSSLDANRLGGKDASSYVTQDDLNPLATAVANLAISVPRSEDADRLGGRDATSYVTQEQLSSFATPDTSSYLTQGQLNPLATAVANQTNKMSQVESQVAQTASTYSSQITDLESAQSQLSSSLTSIQNSMSGLSNSSYVTTDQFNTFKTKMENAFTTVVGPPVSMQSGTSDDRNAKAIAQCLSGYTAIAVTCETSGGETYLVSEQGSFVDGTTGACNFRYDYDASHVKTGRAKVLCVDSTLLR